MIKKSILLFAVILIHVYLLNNLQFTAWPEMLSFPYLASKGFSLYNDMVHPYPPMLTIILQYVYELFGFTEPVLKGVTYIFIIISDVLLFLIAEKISSKKIVPFLSIIFYILVQPVLEGNMLWFDTATVPFLLGGMYFYLKANKEKYTSWTNITLSGYFLILGTLVKQTAAIYLIIIGFAILLTSKKFKNILYFLLAPLLLSLTLLLKLISTNSLINFINWTLYYPSKYWTQFPEYVDVSLSVRDLGIIVLILIPYLLYVMRNRLVINTNEKVFSILLLGAFLAVYPRFSFYHFQPAIALTSILVAIALSQKSMIQNVAFMVSILLFLYFVAYPRYKLDWNNETRFASKSDFEFSRLLEKSTDKNNTIFFLGPHSGNYVYADRLPPKPWFDNFGWYYEIPGIQEEVLSKWSTNPPSFVVWTDAEPGHWYELGTYQPQKVTAWIESNYDPKVQLNDHTWLWENKSR